MQVKQGKKMNDYGIAPSIMARALGVSTSALRFWEKQGRLQPKRTASGHRLYDPKDIERLRAEMESSK